MVGSGEKLLVATSGLAWKALIHGDMSGIMNQTDQGQGDIGQGLLQNAEAELVPLKFQFSWEEREDYDLEAFLVVSF